MIKHYPTDYLGDVIHFHLEKGLTVGGKPAHPSQEVINQRICLVEEEAREAVSAMEFGSVYEVAKELADLLYVTLGAAVAFGIDLDAVWNEVHHSNMTKDPLPDDLPSWTKVPKGNNYEQPDIASVLNTCDCLVAESEVRA